MSQPDNSALQGTTASVVRAAIKSGDPLPGTRGFAGHIDEVLVRDVLGRYPLFFETNSEGDLRWSPDPTALTNPTSLAAGHKLSPSGLDQLWTLPAPEPQQNSTKAIRAVRAAIDQSVSESSPPHPVAFSGGLDSAILAAKLGGPLYVVGFPGSNDIEVARSAARELGCEDDLRIVEFTHADIQRVIPLIVTAIQRTHPMDVSISIPLYLVAEQVSGDGHSQLLLGQGADELFGGYSKIANAATDHRVAANTVRGATRELIDTIPDQVERDVLVIRAAGVEPVFPLLHDAVVKAAIELPEQLLVQNEQRKVALRAAADYLPASIRFRQKKAIQYGSLATRELDRLAREAGFKRRMEDHLRQYITAICENS